MKPANIARTHNYVENEVKMVTYKVPPKTKMHLEIRSENIHNLFLAPAVFGKWKTYATIKVEVYSSKKVVTTFTPKTFKPGPGYFKNTRDLLNVFNENADFVTFAKFDINKGGLVTLTVNKACVIDFGGLEHHLGFDNKTLKVSHGHGLRQVFTAQRLSDMTRGTHHFFIYCSLTKPVMVNNQLLSLIGTVDALKGGYAEQTRHNVAYPIFIDCVEGSHQTVEFTISDDKGNISDLLMGRTLITCSVRNSSRT